MNCGLPCKLKGQRDSDGRVEPCKIVKELNAGSKERLRKFLNTAKSAGKMVEEVEVMFGPPTKSDEVDFYESPKAAKCTKKEKKIVVIKPGFEPADQLIPCWGRCSVLQPADNAEVISATYELGLGGSFWNIIVAVSH